MLNLQKCHNCFTYFLMGFLEMLHCKKAVLINEVKEQKFA